jgi:hypothetical protein
MVSRLSLEQMGERLTLKNPYLIRKVLAYAEQYWQEALKIKAAADDKAQKGFQMAALAMTLLFSLGAFVVHWKPVLVESGLFLLLFVLGGAALLASAVLFFLAGKKRSHFVLSHHEILHADVLKDADETEGPGVLCYERNMARHFLDLGLEVLNQNQRGAGTTRAGETPFISGIAVLIMDLFVFFFKAVLA